MRVTCLKNIRLTDGKAVKKGTTLDLPHTLAVMYVNIGAVEPAHLAEVRENPEKPAGEPLSASQAGRALPQTIVSVYDSGALETKPEPQIIKKRGRPKKRS